MERAALFIPKAVYTTSQFDHFWNPMSPAHERLYPLKVQNTRPVGKPRSLSDHSIKARLQATHQRRCHRLGPCRPRHAPDVLQDITERLWVQRHDCRCVGQGNTRFGNLPSRDRSHFTDGLGQEQVWRSGS
jgi:hypothetical protein